MKKCTLCNQLKEEDNFYKTKNSKDGYASRCKDCMRKYQNSLHKEIKYKLIEEFGGKCSKCGYNKCIAALDFHHRDPNEKEFILSNLTRNLDKLREEASKCDILCANCHREEHYRLYNASVAQ